MILYQVRAGIITILSVKKETECGWRQHNGGFINRRSMGSGKYASLSSCYYTVNDEEALNWANLLRQKLSDTMQASNASITDLSFFADNGYDESNIPKSRLWK